jgi:hypothetical protein
MWFEFVINQEDILPAPVLVSGNPTAAAGGSPEAVP